MENLNLNFSQIINLFVEADLKIKNLEGANKFLEEEVKQLKWELENVPRETSNAIFKPDEAKELISTFFMEGLNVDGIVEECEEATTIESEDYGGYLRIEKNVSTYDIETRIQREMKGLVEDFFTEFRDRILVLHEADQLGDVVE
jgi:hypothetical protein